MPYRTLKSWAYLQRSQRPCIREVSHPGPRQDYGRPNRDSVVLTFYPEDFGDLADLRYPASRPPPLTLGFCMSQALLHCWHDTTTQVCFWLWEGNDGVFGSPGADTNPGLVTSVVYHQAYNCNPTRSTTLNGLATGPSMKLHIPYG